MEHHDRLAGALVEVVHGGRPSRVEGAAREGVATNASNAVGCGSSHAGVHHSSPSIRQFRPLPMPRKPTRSPGWRNSRSSARAAVSGSETVPMLPRYGKVREVLLRSGCRAP